MKSIWNNVKNKEFNKLQGDKKTDVLIIGGGMCGILCAYMLKNANINCILVESNRICSATTNYTTAKVTVQHGLIYSKLIKTYGLEKAQMYYESQNHALKTLVKLASTMNVDCENSSSYVYSLNNISVIEEELEALGKIGCSAKFSVNTELPFDISGSVVIENQAKIHPLKFAYKLSESLNIYENTKVLDINNNVAITDKGRIFAKRIIVATHFPFINKYGGYFLKMYQHRSYVIALENAQKLNGMYVDEDLKGLSFRNYENYLLLGGGSHRTGHRGGNFKELRSFARKHYPQSKEVGNWATQDCMTLDSVPYIGTYSRLTPDLYVATGFNKWGMTSSMVSAMILSDAIQGRKNEYAGVYLPSRTVMHPQLATNMLESLKGLLTFKTPRCPHLGCALRYNKQEHSWDCPCHGSRFDEKGRLINNPSKKDLF